MSRYSLFLICLFCLGCSSSKKEAAPVPVATPVETRPRLIEEKKAEALASSTPARGKFLQYIYRIQPDHKQPGYTISTNQLNDGYAFGSGPYDGAFLEFFLFQGIHHDIVIRQTTGYEVSVKDTKYGAKMEPFAFRKGKMRRLRLSRVFPIFRIEQLFEKQILKLAPIEPYQSWEFHRLIQLPKTGTTSPMLVCELAPEPPFATETKCVKIGELRWNRKKFEVRALKQFELTKATI